MEDRELLEMAARAAGIEHVDYEGVDYDGSAGLVIIGEHGQHLHGWNPLADDGDALRLAMKLSISVDVNAMHVHADCRHCAEDIGYFEENTARNDGCIFKAARRAIVRAAAGIGETLP